MKKNSPSKDKRLQTRFAHYLRSFRDEKKLTQNQLAEKLGVANSLVPKLESTYPYPRIIATFEYLEQFSKLTNISMAEFVSYLEGDEYSKKIEGFNKIRAILQLDFKAFLKDNRDKPETLNRVLSLMIRMSKLPDDQIFIIEKLLTSWEK